jgi:hypothetical protein
MHTEGIAMKTITSRTLIALSVATAISACGVRSKTTEMGTLSRPASCEAVIQVFDSRADIPHDYYELAFIEAEGSGVYTTDKKIEDQIIKRAAQVGATAIVANPVKEAKTVVKRLGEALGTNSATTKASALAIYMPADNDRLAQLCGVR